MEETTHMESQSETTSKPPPPKNLAAFLKAHVFSNKSNALAAAKGLPKGSAGTEMTHTRIPGKPTNHEQSPIHGGSYSIPDEDMPLFWDLYHKKIFLHGQEEYLTEKQLNDDGPILIDLDFRYASSITTRQHTHNHILAFLSEILLLILRNIFVMHETTQPFRMYVFEKDDVNVLADGSATKDGIHIVVGLQASRKVQLYLREQAMQCMQSAFDDLPIINTWDKIYDETIARGSTNWQIFGSRKPYHTPYKLTMVVTTLWDESVGTIVLVQEPVENFPMRELLPVISARNRTHPVLEMYDDMQELLCPRAPPPLPQHEKRGAASASASAGASQDKKLGKKLGSGGSGGGSGKQKRITSPSAFRIQSLDEYGDGFVDNDDERDSVASFSSSLSMSSYSQSPSPTPSVGSYQLQQSPPCKEMTELELQEVYATVKDADSLDNAIENVLRSVPQNLDPLKIRMTHEYAQLLPPKFYEPGSHLLNRKLAFGLKMVSDKFLFLSWVKVRSKAEDFDYGSIESLYNSWKHYFNIKCGTDGGDQYQGITYKSIMYWAREHNYDGFMNVKKKSINELIINSLQESTEFDFAYAVHCQYRENYVCSNINPPKWHRFENHRWVPDQGNNLRLSMSQELYPQWKDEISNMIAEAEGILDEKRRASMLKRLQGYDVCAKQLKRTSSKNNIFRECAELFFDSDFGNKIDEARHLMSFSNGVLDLSEKEFRDGRPEDYITKCTRIPYYPLSYYQEHQPELIDAVHEFMRQIFPIPAVARYMWEHLASSLFGKNLQQTFNIYYGSGSNGKSLLTELMNAALGDYFGLVPVTILTEKRPGAGSTCSELAQLKGVRYVVTQEPSRGAKLTDGFMKQMTGDESIQARDLYDTMKTISIQFTLVCCLNSLFEVSTDDDGTWRRIRKVDFISKFGDKTKEPHLEHIEFVFPKDLKLKEKLPIWAPVFMSILVDIFFRTEGMVEDCAEVLEASQSYRENQNVVSPFVKECVKHTPGQLLSQRDLWTAFQTWFKENPDYQGLRSPKRKEVIEYMEKVHGRREGTSWKHLTVMLSSSATDGDGLSGSGVASTGAAGAAGSDLLYGAGAFAETKTAH